MQTKKGRMTTKEGKRRCYSQSNRDEHPIPHMAPGTMPQVVAQSSNFDTVHVAVCDSQLGLALLDVGHHFSGEVCYACEAKQERM